MPKGRKAIEFTTEEKLKIVLWLATGNSRVDIAKWMKVSPRIIYRYTNQLPEIEDPLSFVTDLITEVYSRKSALYDLESLKCQTCFSCDTEDRLCRAEPPIRDNHGKAQWPQVTPMKDWCREHSRGRK